MATIQTSSLPASTAFHVQYEKDSKALARVMTYLDEQTTKISATLAPSSENPVTISETVILRTSLIETTKFTALIPRVVMFIDHETPLPQNNIMTLAGDYNSEIVVSYDSHATPQAFGLLLLNSQEFRGQKAITLHSIITAFRNLRCPQAEREPNRVKGAGSSIIDFCKKEGRGLGAKYLQLVAATEAISFYKKHNFKIV